MADAPLDSERLKGKLGDVLLTELPRRLAQVLRDDKRTIFTAASQAARAASFSQGQGQPAARRVACQAQGAVFAGSGAQKKEQAERIAAQRIRDHADRLADRRARDAEAREENNEKARAVRQAQEREDQRERQREREAKERERAMRARRPWR